MKLIDAENLVEYKASDSSKLTVEYKASGGSKLIMRQKGWNDAIDTIEDETPTVDAVEVVRCKDCEFSSMPNWVSCEVYCTKHSNWFKINGYCHLGRREDAD